MTKSRFFCSASAMGAALALGAVGQAAAQGTPAGQQAGTTVGEVVVTGSFIRGTPEDAALPVDVISQEDLERQGAPSTLELIKQLSVSSGVLGDTNQFDPRAQGSEGSGSINLRGLGAQRTLVLMNGRRMSPNPFGQAGAGIVDTNTIPSVAIGRVEVLKEGAAATYGSDAIGGVVNFITRAGFEGMEASASYRHIDGSNGDYTAGLLVGHAWDNGNILLSAGWQHRSELKVTDRDWAVRPFAENPEGGWSGGSSVTGFLPVTQTGTGAWVPAGAGVLDAGCAPLGGIPVPGALPQCRFHYIEYDNLIEEEDRYQLYGEINADLAENHRLHVEALWAKTDVPNWKTSPSYLTLQTPTATTNPTVGSLTPAVLSGWFVPAANPGLAAYRAANPGAVPAAATGVHLPGVFYRPLSFGGIPIFGEENEGSSEGLRQYEAFRGSASLRGDLPWMGIGYDVALTYGQQTGRRTGYDTIVSRLQLALRGFGTAAGDPNGCTAAETNNFTTNAGNAALGCHWFNPFSNAFPSNAISGAPSPQFNAALANNPDVIRWFFEQVSTKQTQRIFVADAVLNGTTGFELSGGEVRWAAGIQVRKDGFESEYNDLSDIDAMPCIDTPITGATNCASRNGALVFLGTGEEADLERNVWAAFGELSVPVTDAIQIQLAIRYEDYENVGTTTNPKANIRWQVADWLALRASAGSTFRGPPLTQLNESSVTALSFIAGSFRAIDLFGNPDLEPETADNFSVGAILDFGSFKATVDWWRFDFDNPIVGEPSASIVNTMFPATGPNQCANAALRSRFTFQGDCAAANIARVRTSWVNGPKIKTSGIDVLADYDFGDVWGGNLRAGLSATYTLEYKIDDVVVEGTVVERAYDAVGLLNYQQIATSLPELKGSGYVEYSRGPHNLRFTVNHIGSYTDQRVTIVGPGKKIDETWLAEVDYRVLLPWDTTVTVSVDNLFDQDPSFARLDLSYDPFTGNALGRTYKIGVRKRF